jgi:predicted aldo/keto reductase-like oxidoreductase
MRYQFRWQDVDPKDVPAENQANLEATIRRALELGIHHIETARGYGSSEMQLGFVLPKLPRDKIIVQTKVSPDPDPKVFRDRFEQSMRYLGLDSVDLFSLHGINNAEILGWAGPCLDVARQFQKQGRVRFIGFSTHATCNVILKAIHSGEFDYVNLHWYFVNDLNWPAVEAAAARDMGVFIISPNDKGGMLYQPPPKLLELCRPLSPMIFNDLYCLARPQVHTLSCGAARPGDFDEHLRALELPEDAHAPVEKRLRAEVQRVLPANWRDGLPEYDTAPGHINVVEIVRLWLYAKALDLVEWARMRYNLLGGNGGHWFPGEMAVNFDDAEMRAACAASPIADQIPDILREAHAMLLDAPKKRLSQS